SPNVRGLPSRAANSASIQQQATDAWGHIVDGRDAYMRDMIWAAIVDWYRECPIPPTEREVDQKLLEVFAVYERKVRSQDPAKSLDDEGRGLSAFRDKWAYAMRQWDTKIATAAKDEPFVSRDDPRAIDRKSTRLNSSHVKISYAVFCL